MPPAGAPGGYGARLTALRPGQGAAHKWALLHGAGPPTEWSRLLGPREAAEPLAEARARVWVVGLPT